MPNQSFPSSAEGLVDLDRSALNQRGGLLALLTKHVLRNIKHCQAVLV